MPLYRTHEACDPQHRGTAWNMLMVTVGGWLRLGRGIGVSLLVFAAGFFGTAPFLAAQTSTTAPASERREELKHQADDAYRARDFAAAVSLTSQVLATNPNDTVALYLRGSARVEQGIAGNDADLIRAGVEDARSAIRLDPGKKPDYYLPYLFGMSHLTKIEGNRSHAEMAGTVASQLLARPGLELQVKANILYQRGIARMQLQQYDEAADDLRRAVELSSTHLGARMALSDTLLKAGDVKAAEESLNAAVATFPSSPLVFNNRGMFYQSQRRTDEAIADFTQAISLNPKYAQAFLNRGFTLVQSGDSEAAIGDFNMVLDLQPENASAFSLRGTARLRNRDVAGAIPDYTRAVELDPANATARADLGFAYLFAGDYKTAAAAFDQSLTLQPKNDFLKPWRYLALARSGQEDIARQSYASLKNTPLEQQSWFDALTLLQMGELTEDAVIGRVESRDARLKDAQICEAYYFIGVTKQQSSPEDAAAYFRRALRSQATQLSAYQAAQLALEGTAGNR